MSGEPGNYESKLNSCLEQVSQIFKYGENEYKAKIKTMEEERAVFIGLLDNRKNLEKENLELKEEIKILKEEISYLQLRSTESKSKYDELEKRYIQFRKQTAKKQSDWHRFLNTAKKKCHCDYQKIVAHFEGPSSSSSSCTPNVKVKNISNVFFKSPVKPKFNQSDIIALAPMTEDYDLNTPDGACKASTPLIVGETEKTPYFLYEIHSSDDDTDDELLNSPSLFANNDTKLMGETPRTLKVLKTNDVNKKPIGLDKSVDVFDFGRKKNKNIETSVELFDDTSPPPTTKDYSNNVRPPKKNGKENFDVSVDQFDFNINFGKQNDVICRDKCAPNKEKCAPDKRHIVPNKECLLSNKEQFAPNKEQFTPNKEQFAPNKEQFVPNKEQFAPNKEQFKPNKEQFAPNKEQFAPTKASDTDVRYIDADYNSEIPESAAKKSKYTQEQNIVPDRTKQSSNSTKSNNNPLKTKEKENTDNKIETVTNYKYSTVVRKKDERAKLNGYACEDCKRYYQSDNLSDSRLKEVLKHCSRHKHVSSPPPSTPENFWTIDFPPTQDCIDKGYMLDHNTTVPDYAKPKWQKAKSKKNMKFE